MNQSLNACFWSFPQIIRITIKHKDESARDGAEALCTQLANRAHRVSSNAVNM